MERRLHSPKIPMRILPAILIVLVLPVHGSAQVHPERQPPLAPHFPTAADYAPPPAGPVTRVLQMVGGAMVGAWVGFMASQVAVSDWEDRVRIDRGDWAAGGAFFGMALGLTLPGGPGLGRSPSREARRDRTVIRLRELREAQAENVYELIRSLRPEWLRTRGTASMRETPRGRSTGRSPRDVEITQPGISTLKVYLDDSHLGGLDVLRELQPGSVGEIRFLDTAEATMKWGAGHLHGAIHVITAPAS